MKPEVAVLDIQGLYRVYTEFYRADAAEKTIILINGSLATTASFAQSVRNLHPNYNVVLFDQPYAGKSRAHNPGMGMITKRDEGHILLELIDHFNAEHVMSFSWGSASTLLALADKPRRVERAIVSSFSPVINDPMRDYLERGMGFLSTCDRNNVGNLINDTIGKYLPSLFKRFNFRHCSSLAEHEYLQMNEQIHEVLHNDMKCTLDALRKIDIPLLFINGELDEYTTVSDARKFSDLVNDCQFSTIASAGHFLDMEHKSACEDTRRAMMGFLKPKAQEQRTRLQYIQGAHAFAF